jgi:Arabinogalactan endo-1,4-beta-galactosidase
MKRILKGMLGGMLATAMTTGYVSTSPLVAQEIPYKDQEISVRKVENLRDDFILGTDASSVISLEDSGVTFYDFDGNEQDVFKTMSESGVNYIRVKIWNDPYDNEGNGYGGGNSDLEKAIQIGKRATQYNMKLLVNFHYSDFWADPGRQNPPKAWENMPIDEKSEALYNFTFESLQELRAHGIDIGMVQVGNETTGQGIAGETSLDNKIKLYQAGTQAVRDFDSDVRIILHFTNPEKGHPYFYTKEVYGLVDFDIVATSFYSVWHGSLRDLANQLNKIVEEFDKEVMVAETAYPYTLKDGDDQKNIISDASQVAGSGYEISPNGQANSFRDIVDLVNNDIHNEKGVGVFYWENTWIPINEGLGNRETNMPIWEEFGAGWATKAATFYDRSPYGGHATLDNYGGNEVDNQAMFDFAGHPLQSLKVFEYVYTGHNEDDTEIVNLLRNGSFEDADMSMYDISAPYVTRRQETPLTGMHSLHFWNRGKVDFTAEQKVKLPAGSYQFVLNLQGGDVGDEADIYAYVRDDNNIIDKESLNVKGWQVWQKATITFTIDADTEVAVGLAVNAAAGAWGTTDDWSLVAAHPVPPREVDKSALQQLVDRAIDVREMANYTVESFSAYQQALQVAIEILESDNVTQEQVDEALEVLLAAELGLEKVEIVNEKPLPVVANPVVHETVLSNSNDLVKTSDPTTIVSYLLAVGTSLIIGGFFITKKGTVR